MFQRRRIYSIKRSRKIPLLYCTRMSSTDVSIPTSNFMFLKCDTAVIFKACSHWDKSEAHPKPISPVNTLPVLTFLMSSIQVLSYDSLVVALQNVPITSILTNHTLGSWRGFDVNLSLIGSKEMIWKTCYGNMNSCKSSCKQGNQIFTHPMLMLWILFDVWRLRVCFRTRIMWTSLWESFTTGKRRLRQK